MVFTDAKVNNNITCGEDRSASQRGRKMSAISVRKINILVKMLVSKMYITLFYNTIFFCNSGTSSEELEGYGSLI